MEKIKLVMIWIVVNWLLHRNSNESKNQRTICLEAWFKHTMCRALDVSTDGRLNRVHTWEQPINDTPWWLGFVLRAFLWFVPRVCCHAVLVSRLREQETGTAAVAALLLVWTKLSSFYLSVFMWLCFCLLDVFCSPCLSLTSQIMHASIHRSSFNYGASFLAHDSTVCCTYR